MLVPALRLYPTASAKYGGSAGWIGGILAVPVAVLYALFLSNNMGGEGLGEAIHNKLRKKTSSVLLVFFTLWFVLYAAFLLRSGADRLVSTIYSSSEHCYFSLTMGIACCIAAGAGLLSVSRTAKIILPVLGCILLPVLVFSFFSVDTEKLFPLTLHSVSKGINSVIPALDVISVCMVTKCFLNGFIDPSTVKKRSYIIWTAAVLVFLTVLDVCVTGSLGAGLTSALSFPFFTLVRSIVFFNAVERVEALLVALWVFPDFLFVSVLFICAFENLKLLISPDEKREKLLLGGVCAASVLLSFFLFPSSEALSKWSDMIIPGLNLFISFFVVPILTGVLHKK